MSIVLCYRCISGKVTIKAIWNGSGKKRMAARSALNQRDRRLQHPVESDVPAWPGQREPDDGPGVGARRADPQLDLARVDLPAAGSPGVAGAVSYTHLTLPTNREVLLSVVAHSSNN